MPAMTETEWKQFISEGSRTGMLASVRPDGRPHCVPVWFVLERDEILFNTGESSVKARNIRHRNRVTLACDSAEFPYAFVSLECVATLEAPTVAALRDIATRIASRYVPEGRAQEYGARNGVEGELLVRLRPLHVFAQSGIAD